MGDFCYYSQPDNADVDQNDNTAYKCQNKFYTEKINDFVKYNCLASGADCPENYHIITETCQCFQCPSNEHHYYEVGENGFVTCHLEGCPNNKEYIKDGDIKRCTSGCINDEFTYKKTEGSTHTFYCYDNNCPTEAKYSYEENIVVGENTILAKECFSMCNKKHFNNNNNICIPSCSNLITVDLTKDIFTCLDEGNEDQCPTSLYPYLYRKDNNNKYCLKSCKDTQDNYFKDNDNDTPKTTYLNYSIINIGGEEKNVKECISTNIASFRIDEISLKWIDVDDCKSSLSGPYHNSTHCKQSCDNYYIFTTLECNDSCPNNDANNPLYLDEATGACYENCPTNLGRGYLNPEKTKCRSCNIPKATNPNMTEEGYYKSGEKICYESCSSLNSGTDIYYHNNGENICFKGGCGNIYKYEKYESDSNSNICYKSCLDIGDSYTIEINNICYQQLPDGYSNYYYYVLSTGIKKYFEESKAFNECSQQLLYYVKNKQCIKQCDTNDYIILPTDQKLGECYSSLDDLPSETATEYTFYNKTKILKKECDLLKIMDSNDVVKVVDEANCVTECPSGYYEYVSEKICKEAYDNTYYVIEESNRKKCISETDCKKYKYVPPDTADVQEKKVC